MEDITHEMEWLARALELNGFYNAAKLFHALAYSEIMKSVHLRTFPQTPEDLVQAIDQFHNSLETNTTNQIAVKALLDCCSYITNNQTIPFHQAPTTFVCRTCGKIYLKDKPDRCEKCGAYFLTLREFPAIYYLEPLSPREAFEALSSTPDDLTQLLSSLSETQLNEPEQPGEWSLHGAVAHLVVSDNLLAGRVELILSEQNPSLTGVAAWAEVEGQTALTKNLLDDFRKSRQNTLSKLTNIPMESWWRTAFHEEFGQVTLLQQASYFARHERDHWAQIERIRRKFA